MSNTVCMLVFRKAVHEREHRLVAYDQPITNSRSHAIRLQTSFLLVLHIVLRKWRKSEFVSYLTSIKRLTHFYLFLARFPGKTFDVTYVRLVFKSSRPNTFSIWKKTNEESDWVPFQYFSESCMSNYNLSNLAEGNLHLTRANETSALCTKEYTDITPVTGGNVIFTTLDQRPSAENLEHSPALQEFITASHIQIRLEKMNTFGEIIFNLGLRQYYYAIHDISVGGL